MLKTCYEADPVQIATINEVLALLTRVNPCNCQKCQLLLGRGGPAASGDNGGGGGGGAASGGLAVGVPQASGVAASESLEPSALSRSLSPELPRATSLALVPLEDDTDYLSQLQALAAQFISIQALCIVSHFCIMEHLFESECLMYDCLREALSYTMCLSSNGVV